MLARSQFLVRSLAFGLLAIVCTLWWASTEDPAQWTWGDRRHRAALLSQGGEIVYLRWGPGLTPWARAPGRALANVASLPAYDDHTGALGLLYYSGLPYRDTRFAHTTFLAVPYWLLALVTWLALLYAWRDRNLPFAPIGGSTTTCAPAPAAYTTVRLPGATFVRRPLTRPAAANRPGKRWLDPLRRLPAQSHYRYA